MDSEMHAYDTQWNPKGGKQMRKGTAEEPEGRPMRCQKRQSRPPGVPKGWEGDPGRGREGPEEDCKALGGATRGQLRERGGEIDIILRSI